MPNRVAVTSADFIRNIGFWQSEALRHPISITHHGRERLVLASPEQFNSSSDDAELQRALSASRSLASAILDQAEEGFLHFDEHLHITAANRLADELLGKHREETIGAAIADIFPSLAANVWSSHLQRVLRSRKTEVFESQVNHVQLHVRTFPLADGVAALFQNTTEEVRLREICESADAQIAALSAFEQFSCIHASHQGRVEYADEAFGALTGFSVAELFGHRVTDLLSATGRRPYQQALERVLRGGERIKLASGIVTKGGEDVPVRMSLAPILSDVAVRGAFIAVLADKT